MMSSIIISSIIIMFASLSGVFFIWNKLGKIIERNLSFLVSFSAGVFLFVTYLLTIELFHLSESSFQAIIWFLTGIVIFYSLFKFLPHFHHHHDENEEHDYPHNKIDAKRILWSDGVHNIEDGILLTASFAAGPLVGIFTTISIFVHEFVQEVSEFFVLKQAGYKTKKALWINFFVSGTILIGAIGSYFLFETFEILEVPLIGIAAGSFLVVVLNDLIPHSIRSSKNKTHYAKHLAYFILGIILMSLISSGFEHEHEHGHDHDHNENEVHLEDHDHEEDDHADHHDE